MAKRERKPLAVSTDKPPLDRILVAGILAVVTTDRYRGVLAKAERDRAALIQILRAPDCDTDAFQAATHELTGMLDSLGFQAAADLAAQMGRAGPAAPDRDSDLDRLDEAIECGLVEARVLCSENTPRNP